MIVIYHLWQWMKHAWLHSDLFQPLNVEYSTVPGFQQWEPEFLSMHGKRMITITELAFIYYISIKSQNVHRCVEYLAHLPIHLHGSLQCHAQLTLYIYIYIYIHLHLLNCMSSLTIIFQKTNMCTHMCVCVCVYIYIYILVYASTCIYMLI